MFRCDLFAQGFVGIFVDRQDAINAAMTATGASVVIPTKGVRGAFAVHELVADGAFSELTRENCSNIVGLSTLHAEGDVEAFVTTDGFVVRASDCTFQPESVEGLEGVGGEGLGQKPLVAFERVLRQVFDTLLDRAIEGAGDQLQTDPAVAEGVAEEVAEVDEKIASCNARIRDLQPKGRGPGGEPIPITDAVQRKIKAIEATRSGWWQRRNASLQAYPLLSHVDPVEFLAEGPEGRKDLLYEAGADVEYAVQSLRSANHRGDVDLWGLSPLVVATLGLLDINEADPLRAEIIAEAERREAAAFYFNLALTVFQVGAAVVGAVATSGLSTAAIVAGAAAGAYDASYMTAEWLLHQNLDTLRTGDPAVDLVTEDALGSRGFFVALAWLGLGLDVIDVVRVVRKMAGLGGQAKKLAELVQEFAQKSGRNFDELWDAMQSPMGVVATDEHLAILKAQLGVEVAFEDALGKGCRLDFEPDSWTPVGLRIGRNAQVFDVLAHRLAVDAAREHSGLMTTMHNLWEAFGGKAGPAFPKGTAGWAAHLEIEKLVPITEMLRRRAATSVDDALTQELLEDARFLEARMQHYEEVLVGLAADADPRFIARLTQQTQEAINIHKFPAFEDVVVDGKKLANPDNYWYVANKSNDPPFQVYHREGTNPRLDMERDPSAACGWRLVKSAKKTPYMFPDGTTKMAALEHLCKEGKSFGPYREMLQKAGIADDARVLEKMPDPAGLSADTVRRLLKKAFEPEVLDRMFKDGSRLLTKDDSIEAYREMTADLASSDFGNLGEKWYRRWYEVFEDKKLKPHPQYRNPEGALREPDFFMDGGTAVEVKSTRQGLSSDHDIPQIRDMCELAKAEGAGVIVGGKFQQVDMAKVVFTDPKGAAGSKDALRKLFKAFDGYLEVEVVGAGVARTFDELLEIW